MKGAVRGGGVCSNSRAILLLGGHMPTIYDNVNKKLVDGLTGVLGASKRGDFCVGYFNLRGWRSISRAVDSISAEDGKPSCRLIVGMTGDSGRTVRSYYKREKEEVTQKMVVERKRSFAQSLVKQLTYGVPTTQDEAGLRKLAKQLRRGVLKVKFFGSYPLHAKLYLVHREDKVSPIVGYVGSSNLTLAGLEKQGELNVDVVDSDAAKKLAGWFEDRWNDRWCLDISEDLAGIIEESWAGGPVDPYEIYIKTAYELSKEAIEGAREFRAPKLFRDEMLEFQIQAVTLAAERLYRHRGVIISDVVGLGKTLVASAVAKTFQDDYGGNVLVICPANLKEMWNDYRHKYEIAGEVLSLGSVSRLENKPRFHTVIVDESHNLRNRESTRYSQVKDYIDANDCRVILLTATPYNKEFRDIGSQLRLFVDSSRDLGIRPEQYIKGLIGEGKSFQVKHPATLVSSLAAFEQSGEVDDWRELIRTFMIRRTRSHIKKNYAAYDNEKGRYYLTFNDGQKYYFPDRKPKCAGFEMNAADGDDQYSSLYSEEVVRWIGDLRLPRYGMGQYLLEQYRDAGNEFLSKEEKAVVKNLNRAGKRLIGFTKSNLFKRLESSGPAFLLSVKRHIVRNAVYLSAFESGGKFPVGDVYNSFASEDETGDFPGGAQETFDGFLNEGRIVYEGLVNPPTSKDFQWISVAYFDKSIAEDLRSDCETLLKVLEVVPEWKAGADRKLNALHKLCGETHGDEKLLVFTQFKDTAKYLHSELESRNIEQAALVFSGMEGSISDHVKRFSPVSNGAQSDIENPIRVVITTDSLSEGQNLQDCRIVVNFDMPWATIRLVQRVGRVDRIGQKAGEILCYCFLPEGGIERVISLRKRLSERISQSADVIGSDEQFFEGTRVNLKQIYDEQIDLDEHDGETDLVSRAYDIWRQAVKDKPGLKKKIENLPDVVYSAKKSDDEAGVLAYIKTGDNRHILTLVDEKGGIVSQSQSKILDLLECEPGEAKRAVEENHHELVAKAVERIKETQSDEGGQLGGPNTVKNRTYTRLKSYLENQAGTLFYSEHLKQAIEQVYLHSLQENARDRLRRLLNQGITDEELARVVVAMWEENHLLALPKDNEPFEASIICSMGLVK